MITYGRIDIEQSTLAGNTANQGAGGAFYAKNGGYLRDSTLSGNSALVGSAAVFYGSATIESATIAFNTIYAQCQICHPSALNLRGGGQTLVLLSMNNTIAADNDVADVYAYVDFGGANNLIMTSNYSPPDTLHVDPMLGPLATNGSLLPRSPRTHALLSGSPAIDAGGSDTPLSQDERGMPRIVGLANDIGGYESNDDEIFEDGFDGT